MGGLANFFDENPPQMLKSGIHIDWLSFNPTEPFTVPVSSSAIEKIHHNPVTSTTEVYFTDGMEYEYYDIPIHILIEWIQSSSVGRYFNFNIRNNYSYSQVG